MALQSLYCQARSRIFIRGEHEDGGPRARREAPRGLGLEKGAVAPAQYGVWGRIPQKIFEKSTSKLHIFLSISSVWRVTPVAKQSSVCNSEAKYFSTHDGGTFTHVPPLATPVYILLMYR